MRSVRFYPEAWPLHTAFVIARGSRSEARVIVVEIEQDGVVGIGECTPYPHFGESEISVMAQLDSVSQNIENGADRDALEKLLPAGAARNALDSALWNLQQQQSGETLWQLTDTHPAASISMAQTLSVDTPEAMAEAAIAHQQNGATLLKIKLDNHFITERMVAIRAAVPNVSLIVDANESWQSEGLASRCQLLADLGVLMLEQPLPAGQDEGLENFIHPLPICADESCHTAEDVLLLAGRYEMVNIKLDKTGGLTAALKLAAAARESGLEIMLGCMLCTSRAVRAALPLTEGAKFIDLDGPTWLEKDVVPGLAFHGGVIDLQATGD